MTTIATTLDMMTKTDDETVKIALAFLARWHICIDSGVEHIPLFALARLEEVEGRGEELGFEEFNALGFGRNFEPALMDRLWWGNLLNTDDLWKIVPQAWSGADFPGLRLSCDAWGFYWSEAGYTENGVPAVRLTGEFLLYRGCTPDTQRGFSWTPDRERAKWFAAVYGSRSLEHRVYEANVPGRAVLSKIGNRDEDEWVVDTTGLEVRESLDPAEERAA